MSEQSESQWEEFEEKYSVVPRPDDEEEFLYETYGDDLETVMSYDPKKIWTLIDADGRDVVIAGYHVANRTNYILTERPWEIGDEEYVY